MSLSQASGRSRDAYPSRPRFHCKGQRLRPQIALCGVKNLLAGGGYELSTKIQVHWLPDGDHSFRPRKASGRSLDDNLADAIAAVAGFLDAL